MAIRFGAIAIIILSAAAATASPNVPLSDPVYERLASLRALGVLAPYTGGFRPLTRARVQRLLASAGYARDSVDNSWWAHPVERVRFRGMLARERQRPYSTTIRPRFITVGGVEVSCEHEEGRPCGDGVGSLTEIDSSAGYAEWVSASIRLSALLGSGAYEPAFSIDRAYLNSRIGPLAIELGRDAFTLGPSNHTQLAWGNHAPPLDQLRLSTAEPFLITPGLHVNALYILGRLRAPQRYPGNLVSIVRGQFDFGRSIELGVVQVLHLGGEGMPMTVLDFALEHLRRRDPSAGVTDSSNRRFGFNFTGHIQELQGLRLYYELIFEDWRLKRFIDAVRYDADHVVGAELSALGTRRNGVTVELQKTGVRSQEHFPRNTGLTNAGRLAGSPLGQDAKALFAGARLQFDEATVYPWIEFADCASDVYEFVDFGPIYRDQLGITEHRYRFGGRIRLKMAPTSEVELEALFERVENYGFVLNAHSTHVALKATFMWHPHNPL